MRGKVPQGGNFRILKKLRRLKKKAEVRGGKGGELVTDMNVKRRPKKELRGTKPKMGFQGGNTS